MQLSDFRKPSVQDAVDIMLKRYPQLLTDIPNGQCYEMSVRFSIICTKLGIKNTYRDAWDYLGPVSPNRDHYLWNEEFLDNWNHCVVEVNGLVYDFTAHQYDHTLPVPVVLPLQKFISLWRNHDDVRAPSTTTYANALAELEDLK